MGSINQCTNENSVFRYKGNIFVPFDFIFINNFFLLKLFIQNSNDKSVLIYLISSQFISSYNIKRFLELSGDPLHLYFFHKNKQNKFLFQKKILLSIIYSVKTRDLLAQMIE